MVKSLVGLCAAALLATSLWVSTCGVDKSKGLLHNHPLKDKIGFNINGRLKDGRKWDYSVQKEFVWDFLANNLVGVTASESVWVGTSEGKSLADYEDVNNDRKVDIAYVSELKTIIYRNFLGIRYDSELITKEQAQQLLADGDTVFAEVKEYENLEASLNDYSVKKQHGEAIDKVLSK